jgi:hypothetical protein
MKIKKLEERLAKLDQAIADFHRRVDKILRPNHKKPTRHKIYLEQEDTPPAETSPTIVESPNVIYLPERMCQAPLLSAPEAQSFFDVQTEIEELHDLEQSTVASGSDVSMSRVDFRQLEYEVEDLTQQPSRKRKPSQHNFPEPLRNSTQHYHQLTKALQDSDTDFKQWGGEEVEKHLQAAFHEVDLIGELEISEKHFSDYCSLLRDEYQTFNNKWQKPYKTPALFITTMVFFARYKETEGRKFWLPYFSEVWHLDDDGSLNRQCREFFKDARYYFENNWGLSFLIRTDGDVVRPIYRHAILPSYLQDSFSAWLIKNQKSLLSSSPENLLNEATEDSTLPPNLRAFIKDSDTQDAAKNLIEEIKAAISLYQEGESPEGIADSLKGIERELWRKLERNLAQDIVPSRQRGSFALSFKWVWDRQYEDYVLRLSNLQTDKKPDLVQLVQPSHEEASEIRYPSPWHQADGSYLIDRLTFEADVDSGRVQVLAQDGAILFEKDIPHKPTAPPAERSKEKKLQADFETEKLSGFADEAYVFPDKDISFRFSLPSGMTLRSLTLFIQGGNFRKEYRLQALLDENHLEKLEQEATYRLHLANLLLSEANTYSLDIRQGLTSCLDEPFLFSICAGLEIEGPQASKGQIFSPERLPLVTIKGYDSSKCKVCTNSIKHKIEALSNGHSIQWQALEDSTYRVNLAFADGRRLALAWDIQRVYAWVEGAGTGKIINANNIENVVLHVRGRRKEKVSFPDLNRYEELDTKGHYDKRLRETPLWDGLQALEDRLATKIEIEIDGQSWHLFTWQQIPDGVSSELSYRDGQVTFQLQSATKIEGNFRASLHLENNNDTSVYLLGEFNELPYSGRKVLALPSGAYQLHLTAEELSFPISVKGGKLQVQATSAKPYMASGQPVDLYQLLTARPFDLTDKAKKENFYLKYLKALDQKLTEEQYLPAWAVTDVPLDIVLFNNRVITLYPEGAAYRGASGFGYVKLNADHDSKENKFYAFAIWERQSDGQSRLRLKILPSNWKPGRSLVEYRRNNDSLQPAYFCEQCELVIVAIENDKFSLSARQRHKHHNDRASFYNAFDGDHIGDGASGKRNGQHQNLLGIIQSSTKQTDEQQIYLHQPEFYVEHHNQRLNIYNALNTVPSQSDYRQAIEKLSARHGEWALKARKDWEWENVFTAFSALSISAVRPAQKLLDAMKSTRNYQALAEQVFLLAFILRAKARLHEDDWERVKQNLPFSEEDLRGLTRTVDINCPDLFGWSLTWVDRFFVHTLK